MSTLFREAALARAMSVLKFSAVCHPFACISFALLAVPLGALRGAADVPPVF